jgi:2-dehydro-3-deoxy-D-gluconate 5-dehydrogenase
VSGGPFSLEDRVALVTGGSRGIGQAVAVALAQAGADVVVASRAGDVGETVALVEAAGRRCRAVRFDLGDADAVAGAASELLATERIDVLVNNGGIIGRAPATDLSLEDWRAVLAVNLDGLFALTQACARPMLERGAGKIINVASLLSFQGGINASAYAASKHAVAGLTRALANEWAPRGVQVNAIAPGYVTTDNTRALHEDPDRFHAILERIPAGRWGRPDDMAGAAVFLAAAASDYVSGHVLVVDGGWMAR